MNNTAQQSSSESQESAPLPLFRPEIWDTINTQWFGAIKLTYGFASPALTRQIKGRIDPKIDQHASCEVTTRGAPVCPRFGAAVDFLVESIQIRTLYSLRNRDDGGNSAEQPARPVTR